MANTHAAPIRTFFLLIALGSSLLAMNGAIATQTLQQRLAAGSQAPWSPLTPIADNALVFDHPENVVSERRSIEPIISLIGNFLSEKLEFPGPARPPRVQFVSSEQIAIIRYRDLSAKPALLWFSGKPNALDMAYDDANGVIYLSEHWTGGSPAELSVLLHGLVNHTQREYALTYACSQQREEVAFAAQEAWLKLFGRTLSDTFGLDEAAYMLSTQCIP